MAETIASTARGTANLEPKRIVVDMSNQISELKPRVYPLTVLSKKIGKENCHNYKFEWMEDALSARWVTAKANVTDSATTVTMDANDVVLIAVDDLLKVVETGEIMRVTSVSNTSVNVERAYEENGTASAFTSADKILVIGNASKQGSGASAEKYNKVVPMYNYTQIFKTAFSVTNTLNATKLYGGKELARLRRRKGIEHGESIEYAFLFGAKKLDVSGDQPRTTTAGVLQYLKGTENVLTVDTKTVADKKAQTKLLNEFLEKLFTYGNGSKTVLSSPSFISWINELAMDRLQLVQGDKDKTFGLAVTKYLTPHGTLNLVPHPLLTGGYEGYGLALDMENIKYRVLPGRDTKLKTNIQNRDEDGERDMYITEAGLELRQPKTHGLFIIKR